MYNRILHFYSQEGGAGLGRSMQRLAAKDGNVCNCADALSLCGTHNWWCHFLSFLPVTYKRFVYDATRMRLFSIFRVSRLFNCLKCLKCPLCFLSHGSLNFHIHSHQLIQDTIFHLVLIFSQCILWSWFWTSSPVPQTFSISLHIFGTVEDMTTRWGKRVKGEAHCIQESRGRDADWVWGGLLVTNLFTSPPLSGAVRGAIVFGSYCSGFILFFYFNLLRVRLLLQLSILPLGREGCWGWGMSCQEVKRVCSSY